MGNNNETFTRFKDCYNTIWLIYILYLFSSKTMQLILQSLLLLLHGVFLTRASTTLFSLSSNNVTTSNSEMIGILDLSNGQYISHFSALTVTFRIPFVEYGAIYTVQMTCEGLEEIQTMEFEDTDTSSVIFPSTAVYFCQGQDISIEFSHWIDGVQFVTYELNVTADNNDVSNAIILSNVISMIFCFAAIFLFLRFASLRRFPSIIVLFRLVIFLFMQSNYLVLEIRKRSLQDQEQACKYNPIYPYFKKILKPVLVQDWALFLVCVYLYLW